MVDLVENELLIQGPDKMVQPVHPGKSHCALESMR